MNYFLVSKDFIFFWLSIDCLHPLIHLLNVISLSLLLNTYELNLDPEIDAF